MENPENTSPKKNRVLPILRDNSWQFIWGLVGAILAFVSLIVSLRLASPSSPFYKAITGDNPTVIPSSTVIPNPSATSTLIPTATSMSVSTLPPSTPTSQTIDMNHLELQCADPCQGYSPVTLDTIQVTPSNVVFSITVTNANSYIIYERVEGYIRDIDGNQYNMDGTVTNTNQIPPNQKFTFRGTFNLTPSPNKQYIFHPIIVWYCNENGHNCTNIDVGGNGVIVPLPL